MRVQSILCIFLFAVTPAGVAQDFHSRYSQVLNLTYRPAELPPETPEESYLQTFHWFLEAILTSDEDAYDRFYDSFDHTAELVKKAPASSENNYYLTEITIQSGFLKLKFGQELAAAWTMRAAYRLARENYTADSANPLFLKSWGLMQVLVGAIPDNYKWIPELFGVKGSIPAGIALLNDIPSDHRLYLEANVITQLTRSYLLDQSPQAAAELSELIPPAGSPLLDYLYLTVSLRAHQAGEVMDYYASRNRVLDLSTYAVANASLQAGRLDVAKAYFMEFLENYQGQDFRKDAVYKLFLACYMAGDTAAAADFFNRIHSTGTADTESDRYALKAAGLAWPNKNLMKIRLATDGGFYTAAREYSMNLGLDSFETREEKTEFIYRLARLEQLTENPDTAISLYHQVIEFQGEDHLYFAPNACLQLGFIYLGANARDDARKYFSKVFEYRSYEYQKGIERKAHSALVTHFDGS